MTCLDALSVDNYININITVAKLFDLNTAIYWAELTRILPNVKRKETFDDQGYFTLDRKYMENKTTLKKKDQIRCEQILEKAEVLQINETNSDRVRVDVQKMLSLIIEGDSKELQKQMNAIVKKVVPKKTSNAAYIKANMKNYITTTNEDLRKAYCDWIDVIADKGRINKAAVENFQNVITSFTSDESAIRQIVEIGAVRGYIDPTYCIDLYRKQNLANPTKLKAQKICTSVKEDITF